MILVKGDKDVFYDAFALMAKFDDEEDEEEVTLSDLNKTCMFTVLRSWEF